MSKPKKRKITISAEDFFWVLDGNSIAGQKETHIRIHSSKLTRSLLYLDPHDWNFEVRPKTIEQAIRFALSQGCRPDEKGKTMYLSMKGDHFYVLPDGAKFGYQEKEESDKAVRLRT